MFAIRLKESAELFCGGAKLAIELKQLVPQVIMAAKPLLKSSTYWGDLGSEDTIKFLFW